MIATTNTTCEPETASTWIVPVFTNALLISADMSVRSPSSSPIKKFAPSPLMAELPAEVRMEPFTCTAAPADGAVEPVRAMLTSPPGEPP